MKEICLKKSIYQLCTAYPELIELMKELGFVNITKPGMLQSMGKIMTIPKGCRTMKIPLEKVKEHLTSHGFKIID
ncbi:hypothetical protein BKP37_09255 [Anaerobacillus alkalilacustris]|uniref:DUF1858 domain-containing protein n=1 Tax=Anaerobacillus alkalilacustris TaxID=393763 RepID=A0A1S2LNM2_9BACI|nr:DUF1858 domain-containing protein [Anaerobacillus alkalilacustris]OIJ13934.1 hypothetical protein BKP37_09255 [Anaerobacillus alkalilacustris]